MASRSTAFSATTFAAWPLSSGTWTHVAQDDGLWGSYASAPTALVISNTGAIVLNPYFGTFYLLNHADPTNYQPHNVQLQVDEGSGHIIQNYQQGLFLKASGVTTGADYYLARVVGSGDGKTGVGAALAIEKRVSSTMTRLVIDSDVAGVAGAGSTTSIAFRCIERASDVLLQAKHWTTSGSEPAWPAIVWSGSVTANPADGVIQVVDSSASLWNKPGSCGLWARMGGGAWPGPTAVATRGNNSSTTSNTTLAVDMAAAGSIAVGNYLVARIACDNSGASGASPTVTCTDARNTWTQQTGVTRTPGSVANDGTVLRTWWTKVANAYTNGDDVTFTFGNNTSAKAAVIEEWRDVHASSPISGATFNAGATSASPLITITVTQLGQSAVAAISIEGSTADAFTNDSDTDNGVAWSPGTPMSGGAGATGQLTRCAFKQQMLQTAGGIMTPVTYGPTITSRDWCSHGFCFNPSQKAQETPFLFDNFSAQEIEVRRVALRNSTARLFSGVPTHAHQPLYTRQLIIG